MSKQTREVALDTETTGLNFVGGDRVIEIGCVELINHLPTGKIYQTYINPESKKVEEGVPYYVGQHGNNYFTAMHTHHVTELKTCDKFISWGAQYESNVIPTFNFKTLGRKKIFKKDGNLSIICGDVIGEPLHEYYVSEKDQERKAQSILYLITFISTSCNFLIYPSTKSATTDPVAPCSSISFICCRPSSEILLIDLFDRLVFA